MYQRDDDMPKSIGEILKNWTPEQSRHVLATEQAYRRGFHQGWDDAIERIFGLLDTGTSNTDAYSMSAVYVNQVGYWRTRAREALYTPPPPFQRTLLLDEVSRLRERREAGDA